MHQDDNAPPAPNPELEAIRARAIAADQAAAFPEGSAGPGPASAFDTMEKSPQPEPPTFAEQLAGVMLTLGQTLAMRFASLKPIYTPERCQVTAEAIAPALERLGWTFDGAESMIYLNAAGAALMLGMETHQAIQHDLAIERGKAAAATGGKASPAPAPGPPISPGPGVHDQVNLYK